MLKLSRFFVVLLAVSACGDDHVSADAAVADAPRQIDAPIPIDAPATNPVTIAFAAQFGSDAFTCGGTYQVGTPVRPLTVTDLRFYVYDVALVAADGTVAPVALTPGPFQSATLAMLDFENGCGTDGTPEMHTAVTGTVTGGPFTQIRFTVGVPPALDHLDLTTQAPPLDATGMWWAWQYGYKFLKLDATTPALAGSGSGSGSAAPLPFFLHLGSSGCPGTDFGAPPPAPCEFPNQITYQLPSFDAATQKIVVDVGAALATTDVSVNTDGTAPGCMSEPADPECELIFPRLGVYNTAPQVLFSVQ